MGTLGSAGFARFSVQSGLGASLSSRTSLLPRGRTRRTVPTSPICPDSALSTAYELDARQMPANWSTGYWALGTKAPGQLPNVRPLRFLPLQPFLTAFSPRSPPTSTAPRSLSSTRTSSRACSTSPRASSSTTRPPPRSTASASTMRLLTSLPRSSRVMRAFSFPTTASMRDRADLGGLRAASARTPTLLARSFPRPGATTPSS